MTQFQYKARTGSGEVTSGMIAAPSIDEASRKLREGDQFVIDLQPAGEETDDAGPAGRRGRIKREHVVGFTQQLAVMIEAGATITEALECAVDQAENDRWRQVLSDVQQQVESGESLSASLERHPEVFPVVMVSLLRASEASGTLGRMLERITTYMTKEMQTTKKVRGALIYPAIMLATVCLVTIFLLTVIMPRLAGVYEAKGAALPVPTQILMTLSDTMTSFWYLWLIGAALAGIGLWRWIRSDRGHRLIDTLKVRTPVLGPMFQKLYIHRSCRVMGMMIAAGLPILDIIELVRQVTNNTEYEQVWGRVASKLEGGAPINEPLFESSLFPRFVAQMIASGEKSGRLGHVLDRVAEVTEQNFDEQVKTTTQLIEPTLILVMGSIIGFMALAMLLPIFTVSRAMGG
jgi:type IV pilus assembly protein PilC